ncbi:MAG: hypothetical protein H8D58_01500 [Candidatus Marinimicrobia bacterium]|nr:hypothetical protein [Candidatus Neomarinimicrobiota bacterium]
MNKIILLLFFINMLFPINGKVVFFDGTTIDGQINSITNSSVYITPIGLDFPQEILMNNIDSLKTNDGKILVASNTVLLLYENGVFISPAEKKQKREKSPQSYEVEYVIIPNWSLNIYTGYPLIKASSFDYYDDLSPIFGLSVGSPYGVYLGDFFMNVIAEIAYYNFKVINNPNYESFSGLAYQIGVSPGFFIGETSISLTLCTGKYHAGSGFIGGGSLDLPLGDFILDKFGNNAFVEAIEDHVESLEMRITSRLNIVKKSDGGTTGWVGGGISLGYEF